MLLPQLSVLSLSSFIHSLLSMSQDLSILVVQVTESSLLPPTRVGIPTVEFQDTFDLIELKRKLVRMLHRTSI